MAELMAAAADEAEVGRAVGIGDQAGIEVRHRFVLRSVQHKQRLGRELFGGLNRSHLSQLGLPAIDARRERPTLDNPDFSGVGQEAVWGCGPVVKVGWGARDGNTGYVWVVSGRHQTNGAAGSKPTDPETVGFCLGLQIADSGRSVIDPAGKAEFAGGFAAASEPNGERVPLMLDGDALAELAHVAADLVAPDIGRWESVQEQDRDGLAAVGGGGPTHFTV